MQKTISALQKGVLAFWVVCLAIGTRYILTSPQDFGPLQHLEYLSIAVPASLIASWALLLLHSEYVPRLSRKWHVLLLLLGILTIVFIRALYSANPSLSVWWVVLVATYAITAITIRNACIADRRFLFVLLKSVIFTTAAVSAIGLIQLSLGRSIGLFFLGEQVFTDHTIGIAKLVVDGATLVRPMGTFLHANIFGGFMVVGLVAFLLYSRERNYGFVESLTGGLIALGLIASYSRTAWIAGLLFVGLLFVMRVWPQGQKVRNILPAMLAGIFALLIWFPGLTSRFNITEQSDQISLRTQLHDQATEVFVSSPANILLGTGLHNYVPQTDASLAPYERQPVHNAFYEVIIEIGIFGGVISVLLLIIAFMRYGNGKSLLLAMGMLPIAYFDHYLVTTAAGLTFCSMIFILVTVGNVPRGTFLESQQRT